jgi:hypothetical protein
MSPVSRENISHVTQGIYIFGWPFVSYSARQMARFREDSMVGAQCCAAEFVSMAKAS